MRISNFAEEVEAVERKQAKRTLKIIGNRRRNRIKGEITLGKRLGRKHRHSSASAPRIFKCHLESCGKILSDRASLKKHMTVHGDKLVSNFVIACSFNALSKVVIRDFWIMQNSKGTC